MGSFLNACGTSGPLTIAVEGPGLEGAGRRELAQPFALIGRHARSDVVLDHAAVSGRHAYLQLIDGRAFVVDLDSRSGMVLDDRPIDCGWLSPGRVLRIGPFGLRLDTPADEGPAPPGEDPPPVDSPLVAPPAESRHLPKVALEFQSRGLGHSVWSMKPVLALVGSSPRCNSQVIDTGISKFQCALLRTPRGLWVVDLLGRGGIRVNGTPVRSARLGPGDVLGLGLGQVIVRANELGAGDRTPPPGTLLERLPGSWHPAPTGPSAMGAPTTPAPFVPAQLPAAADPSLSLLLNHFGQMQQQMLDQFQQMMMMQMQMFAGMHRDQMGLVRAELAKIEELKTEMAAIKAELAARPAPARATSPPLVPPPRRPVVPPPRTGPPADEGLRPPNGQAPVGPPPDQPIVRRPDRGEGTPPRTAGPPPAPPVDTHDWLNERLAMIEAEEQGRWQKLMGIFKGKT